MRREHQLDKCGGGRCKCWPLEAVTSVVSGRVYSLPDKISLSHCSCHKLLAISFTAVLTCTTHTQFFLQCLSFQSDHFSFLLSLFRSFILPFALPSLFISFRFFGVLSLLRWQSFSPALSIVQFNLNCLFSPLHQCSLIIANRISLLRSSVAFANCELDRSMQFLISLPLVVLAIGLRA